MEIKFVRRLNRIVIRLPDVYDLQPDTDYQSLVSHSSAEVAAKAWNLTGKQMTHALLSVGKRLPDVRRKLSTAV